MKLELKHIAPYLPYGLKGIEKSYKVIMELHGVSQHGFTLEDGDYDDLRRFKPILRPLSDLTKEIEVNGLKIIPLNELQTVYGYEYLYTYIHKNQGRFNHYAVCFGCLEYLLKWHFDVFGLVPQGLAIDINTLEK